MQCSETDFLVHPFFLVFEYGRFSFKHSYRIGDLVKISMLGEATNQFHTIAPQTPAKEMVCLQFFFTSLQLLFLFYIANNVWRSTAEDLIIQLPHGPVTNRSAILPRNVAFSCNLETRGSGWGQSREFLGFVKILDCNSHSPPTLSITIPSPLSQSYLTVPPLHLTLSTRETFYLT